MSAQIYIYT